MVFEKALVKPVCNWNITKDKFIFQEDTNDSSIYCICLRDNDRVPKVYKFKLPPHAIQDQDNTRWSEDENKFVLATLATEYDEIKQPQVSSMGHEEYKT